MWKFGLWVVGIVTLMANGAEAASYMKTNGDVVNPIQSVLGGDLEYAGPDLEPGADLTSANLTDAHLVLADLFGADLSDAILANAILVAADLTDADLASVNLNGANLTGAYLFNADLGGAEWLGTTSTLVYYNAETDFTNAYSGAYGVGALFDPVTAGWNFVPEPPPTPPRGR